MNKYLLILFEKEDVYTNFSPEEMQQEIEAHGKWIQELGKHYDSGEPLEQAAKTVNGKEKVVTDGPFMESKELVSGFYILKAHNLEEATELSKGCPVLKLGGNVEVREIAQF
ncbi:MAG: hypothetical protein FH748_06845 [Balneolaceae bacterium]|nr:hypothetical protein [Balneolaceae bacterium]